MDSSKITAYMAKHKDEITRDMSQSGGIFTALTDVILDDGGVIYGCVKDSDFSAMHIRADNVMQRNSMRGSKYIQSRIGDTYKECKRDLEYGRKVLYSGTPCQIAGLKRYLNKEYDNLICVDLICHGVPSPIVWKRYIEWWENKKKSRVIDVNFRNSRKFGWHSNVESLTFENGEKVDSKIFASIFYGHYAIRPSCFECPHKTLIREGDISIGDCWGCDKIVPEFDDNKGVSLVMINDDKGHELFEKAKYKICAIPVDIEKVKQKDLMSAIKRPKDRYKFWKYFENYNNFFYLEFRFGAWGICYKLKNKLRKMFQM